MKKICRHTALLLFFLLIISTLSAQKNDTVFVKNLQIEFRASYGFTICHHMEMNIFNAHYPIFELNIKQVTFGQKPWQSKSNYPSVGVSFLYTGIGKIPELGHAYAVIPHMTFNCLKSKKNQLNFNLGIGLGYLTQKYDRNENPKNSFIGSHFNAAINISTEYSRMITNRFGVSAFVGLTHFSNGSTRTPNNGLNIAHAGVATKYFINEPKQRIPRQPSDNQQYKTWEKKNLSLNIMFTYSQKDIDEYLGYGMSWSVYNLQINALKRVTDMSKLGVGFDLVYDLTDKEVLRHKGITFNDIDILKPGINAAYEIDFGKTSFIFNVGCHLAGKEQCEGHVYQKLSMTQDIWKGLFATISLTTHYSWADYIGFGLGYRINGK